MYFEILTLVRIDVGYINKRWIVSHINESLKQKPIHSYRVSCKNTSVYYLKEYHNKISFTRCP